MATKQPAVHWITRLWHGQNPHRPSRLAWLALILCAGGGSTVLVAGLLNRWGVIDYRQGLATLRYAVYGSIGGVILGFIVLMRAATRGHKRGWGVAFAGVLVGLAWLAVPAYYVFIRYPGNPPIHDITTDTDHPPEFVSILPLRADAPNPAAYGGNATAEQQRKFFPNLGPDIFAKPPSAVFPAAMTAAREIGLSIVAALPEQGRIEATQRTLFFGFTDDVVIRLRAEHGGTRVDVRSASRVGRSDLGTNARRVMRYLAVLRARVGS